MKKILITLLIVLLNSIAFSSGSAGNDNGTAHFEFRYFEVQEDPVSTIRILPSINIIEIFDENGVEQKYLLSPESEKFIADEIRADINKVISENTDEVLSKIKEELKSALVSGNFEYAYMIIGSRMFTMSLYYQ